MPRIRPAARVLVFDPENYLLAFRFYKKSGQRGDIEYWSLPGGAVEKDEAFETAAARELLEETGISIPDVGPVISEIRYELPLSSGETVLSDERLYAIGLPERPTLSRAGLTEVEQRVLVEARWWDIEELKKCPVTAYPPGVAEIAAQWLKKRVERFK